MAVSIGALKTEVQEMIKAKDYIYNPNGDTLLSNEEIGVLLRDCKTSSIEDLMEEKTFWDKLLPSYPESIKKLDNNKYEVRFSDGKVKQMNEEEINQYMNNNKPSFNQGIASGTIGVTALVVAGNAATKGLRFGAIGALVGAILGLADTYIKHEKVSTMKDLKNNL